MIDNAGKYVVITLGMTILLKSLFWIVTKCWKEVMSSSASPSSCSEPAVMTVRWCICCSVSSYIYTCLPFTIYGFVCFCVHVCVCVCVIPCKWCTVVSFHVHVQMSCVWSVLAYLHILLLTAHYFIHSLLCQKVRKMSLVKMWYLLP